MSMPAPFRPLPQGRAARIAILDDYLGVALDLADWSVLAGRAEVSVFREAFADEDEAALRLAGFDAIVIMRERLPLPGRLLRRLPDLKLIAMTGPRNPSLDAAAAAELGIAVSNTGAAPCGTAATVELAWALILGITRGIARQDASIRAGGWQLELGRPLSGKVLGLVGLGRLGAAMVPIARAFGMEVIAWSPNLTAERAAAAGALAVSKSELLSRADVVSLHIVLSARTRGLIGAEDLALMKPDAVLVNASRGPLLDEAALLEALHAGRIGGAALDVYDLEPLPQDHPLRTAPRTLLAPHLGYSVDETMQVYYRESVENLLAWLNGAPIRLYAPPA